MSNEGQQSRQARRSFLTDIMSRCVSWPINRLNYESISEEDHAFIDKVFATRSDVPILAKWVMQYQAKTHHFTKRILVISKYRLLTIKHTPTPMTMMMLARRTKISKDIGFLDILKLQVDESDLTKSLKVPTCEDKTLSCP